MLSPGTQNKYCPACKVEKIGPGYPFQTYQFEPCEHIFCLQCTKESIKSQIVRKQDHLIKCLTPNCDSAPTEQQLGLLFIDESVVMDKLHKDNY